MPLRSLGVDAARRPAGASRSCRHRRPGRTRRRGPRREATGGTAGLRSCVSLGILPGQVVATSHPRGQTDTQRADTKPAFRKLSTVNELGIRASNCRLSTDQGRPDGGSAGPHRVARPTQPGAVRAPGRRLDVLAGDPRPRPVRGGPQVRLDHHRRRRQHVRRPRVGVGIDPSAQFLPRSSRRDRGAAPVRDGDHRLRPQPARSRSPSAWSSRRRASPARRAVTGTEIVEARSSSPARRPGGR